jgi:hypothetical protein
VLRRHALAGVRVTLCANHAAVAGRRTLTLDELCAECFRPGDRRAEDRRAGDRRATTPRRDRVVVEVLVDGDRREASRRLDDARRRA